MKSDRILRDSPRGEDRQETTPRARRGSNPRVLAWSLGAALTCSCWAISGLAQQGSTPAPPEKAAPAAQDKSTAPEHTTRTYAVRNGTDVYYRTEESERKHTADGELETQRVR